MTLNQPNHPLALEYWRTRGVQVKQRFFSPEHKGKKSRFDLNPLIFSIHWIQVTFDILSNFKHPYMRIFSTLFSSEVVYVHPGGQLRRKRGCFASRWGPLLRAHPRCSGGHPPERSGSHSWSSPFIRGEEEGKSVGGGREKLYPRGGGRRVRATGLCMCGPGYRHSNPRVQSRLDRELSRRGCVAHCTPPSRGFDGGVAEATIAIRKTSDHRRDEISAARIWSCHRRSVKNHDAFARWQKSQTSQSIRFWHRFMFAEKKAFIYLTRRLCNLCRSSQAIMLW